MKGKPEHGPKGERWSERYEQLRSYVLCGGAAVETSPWALALLMHHGVAHWMGAWSAAQEASARGKVGSEPAPEGTVKEAILLLTEMTLRELREKIR